MKTLEELYKEVIESEELKNGLAEAVKEKKAGDFLKANGCDASEEELMAFLKEKQGELSDEELDSVAGGCSRNPHTVSR